MEGAPAETLCTYEKASSSKVAFPNPGVYVEGAVSENYIHLRSAFFLKGGFPRPRGYMAGAPAENLCTCQKAISSKAAFPNPGVYVEGSLSKYRKRFLLKELFSKNKKVHGRGAGRKSVYL